MKTVELTVPAERVAELTAELQSQFPNLLIGTKDLGESQVSMLVTAFTETPELEQALAAMAGDQIQVEAAPTKAPSLSDLVAKARAAAVDSNA